MAVRKKLLDHPRAASRSLKLNGSPGSILDGATTMSTANEHKPRKKTALKKQHNTTAPLMNETMIAKNHFATLKSVCYP